MPRNVKLLVIAFSILLFWLSFIPSPSVALVLKIPTQSSDGTRIFLSWTEGREDPETIYLQIICDPASDSPLYMPLDPVRAQVSSLQASINTDVFFLETLYIIDCRLYAFDGSRSVDPIAWTDTLGNLDVGHPSTSSIHSDVSSPTKSRPLSSPNSAPMATTTSPPPGSSLPKNASNGPSAGITDMMPSSAGASTTATPDIFPSSGVTGLILTTSTNTMGGESESTRHTSSKGALIGGILGGLALLASFIICLSLHLRRNKKLPSSTTATSSRQLQITEGHGGALRDLRGTRFRILSAAATARTVIASWIPSPFRRQLAQSSIINPLIQSEDYLPKEGKHERLERSHREIEESRRQPEISQSDLESWSNRGTDGNGSEAGLDGEVERLRQQIEAMSRRIQGLEVERLEAEAPPPDYNSSED